VFEPVGAKLFRRDAEAAFEDAGGSLYRFLEGNISQPGGATAGSKDAETENVSPGELESKKKKASRWVQKSASIYFSCLCSLAQKGHKQDS